jgi:pimeloyl-ACP methyl ester carboxylesterase
LPSIQVSADCSLHYLWDDFTDPWGGAETILFIHGNSEDNRAWSGWIPYFARGYRLLRPDWRGYGASTPMPLDYDWSLDRLAEDFTALLAARGVARCHVVAAKIGGPIAMHFAAAKPALVQSLTVIGSPVSGKHLAAQNHTGAEIETQGPEAFYRRTMASRLGPSMPREAVEFWINYMSAAPRSTLIGFNRMMPSLDVTADLPCLACPTLVVIGDGGSITGSVDAVRAWQRTIPRSELLVVPSDSFHLAVTETERVAHATLAFIRNNPIG